LDTSNPTEEPVKKTGNHLKARKFLFMRKTKKTSKSGAVIVILVGIVVIIGGFLPTNMCGYRKGKKQNKNCFAKEKIEAE